MKLSNRVHFVLSMLAVIGGWIAIWAGDNMLLFVCWLYAIRSWAVLYVRMLLWLDDQEEAAKERRGTL